MDTRNNNGGFTLVELMVALSVFTIAMSIISGLFIQALRAQKVLNAVIESSSNTSLMLEQLSREIRLGYSFATSTVPCGAGLPDFAAGIAFHRFRGGSTRVVAYEWNQTAGTLDRTEDMGEAQALSSANVKVNRACFRVSQSGANGPWRVTILGNISPRMFAVAERSANLETTISSRVLPSDIVTPGTCPSGWLTRFTHWTQCPQ